MTQSNIQTNFRLKIFDFWLLHQNEAVLSDDPDKQLKHLFYLYSGKSVDGRLVWAALRGHPDPEALERLPLAYTDVEVDESSGLIRQKQPPWKIDGKEAVLFIFYFLAAACWVFLLGPWPGWVYQEPEAISFGRKIGVAAVVILVNAVFLMYVRYCFHFMGKARAVRLLTQTKRMKIRHSIRLWWLNLFQRIKRLSCWFRKRDSL
ncbi:hypothetical protein RN346_07850 [Halomonas sp. PAMB 3232]|uniref:hypothetical protein n=1 Tax=Halomonas sp. PAMB 3232 TaxID=3075221 RepID=UPI00289996DE|nr:hypothetical protein [Halomonas sp. PAMB 3232]WNL40469.1 hypothetical protein RN346_07850 [Halomonas sp. PAMB 3232]